MMDATKHVQCEHLQHGVCEIASAIAGRPCTVHPSNCNACLSDDRPKSVNGPTRGLAIYSLRKAGEPYDWLVNYKPTPADGPGTELKKILSWFAKDRPGCKCRDREWRMNAWGVEGCRRKVDTIVDWISSEALLRNRAAALIPKAAFRQLVNLAIRRAAGHQAPIDRETTRVIETLQVDAEQTSRDRHLLKNVPIVWTYFAGGAAGDELLYSIRSALAAWPDARVCVVGDRPEWYDGELIEKPRIGKRPDHAFKDCYSKLLRAADRFDRFLWMMDDVYWLRAITYEHALVPKYVRHVTQQRYYAWQPKNKWAKTRARAYQWLIEQNRPTYDFASHLPQPIESGSLLRMESELRLMDDYKNWECCYFNAYYGVQDAQDWGRRFLRINKPRDRITTQHAILNHTDSQFRGAVESYLRERFSAKCKVEK